MQLAMKASRNLHNTMFQGVTRARMYFFHTNPSGRVLNRFSKDMGQVDEILPAVMIDVIQIFLQLFGIIVVIAVVNYYFIIPTLFVGIIFYFLRGYYLSASRNIKRIEATSSFYKWLIWFSLEYLMQILLFSFRSFSNLFAFECIIEWFNNDTIVWRSTDSNQGIWQNPRQSQFCLLFVYFDISCIRFLVGYVGNGGNNIIFERNKFVKCG